MKSLINTRAKSPPRAIAISRALRPSPVFANKVLLGNWVEDRIECPKGGTFYYPPKDEIDYQKMKPQSRQPDFRLNKLNSLQAVRRRSQSYNPCHACSIVDVKHQLVFLSYRRLGIIRAIRALEAAAPNSVVVFIHGSIHSILSHDSHHSCGNFATINDLVYNHLPKPLCGPNQRYYKKSAHQFYPQPDLTKCFGNKTEWGLRSYKHYEWACTDVSDYSSSLYEDTFVPPRMSQYLQPSERKAKNSSFTKTFLFKMTKSKK